MKRIFYFFLLGGIFVIEPVRSATELDTFEHWSGEAPSKPISAQPPLGVEEAEKTLPDFSTLPPNKLTPAQKVGCCIVSFLPCLCAVSCFNACTSLINKATCGCFYECCPCLNCTE
jgi:hypothetical protein